MCYSVRLQRRSATETPRPCESARTGESSLQPWLGPTLSLAGGGGSASGLAVARRGLLPALLFLLLLLGEIPLASRTRSLAGKWTSLHGAWMEAHSLRYRARGGPAETSGRSVRPEYAPDEPDLAFLKATRRVGCSRRDSLARQRASGWDRPVRRPGPGRRLRPDRAPPTRQV